MGFTGIEIGIGAGLFMFLWGVGRQTFITDDKKKIDPTNLKNPDKPPDILVNPPPTVSGSTDIPAPDTTIPSTVYTFDTSDEKLRYNQNKMNSVATPTNIGNMKETLLNIGVQVPSISSMDQAYVYTKLQTLLYNNTNKFIQPAQDGLTSPQTISDPKGCYLRMTPFARFDPMPKTPENAE